MLSMPAVDNRTEKETRDLFVKARGLSQEKKGLFGAPQRYVVVMTPGRLLARVECPKPGSMDKKAVEPIEFMFSSKAQQNITVISYNDLASAPQTVSPATLAQKIPFFGILVGMAYIGHSVVVFEGHPSALVGSLRDATMLVVDARMTVSLQPNWVEVAFQTMPIPNVRIFHPNGQIEQVTRAAPPPKRD